LVHCSNGVIHVVDEVLLPPFMLTDIVDVAVGGDDFSTLVDLLTLAELVEALQGDGPFTVFAPVSHPKEDKCTLHRSPRRITIAIPSLNERAATDSPLF